MPRGRLQWFGASVLGVLVISITWLCVGFLFLLWHGAQVESWAEEIAGSTGVDPGLPFMVVDQLVAEGTPYAIVPARIAPIREYVAGFKWFTDGTRVVQRIEVPIRWTRDEVVFIEYVDGSVSAVDSGAYQNYWFEEHWQIGEYEAATLLESASG